MQGQPVAVVQVDVIEAPDVSVLCRWFEESEQMTDDARKLAERDRDYYDAKQWTAAELATLARRGQPALTINYIKRKVEYLRGFERRLRSDPKAFPRTPHEEQMSEAATDALRFVADQNKFDVTRSDVFEDMMIEGTGGADVVVRPTNDGYAVDIKRVPWDRIFFDPYSRDKDFADARYKGIVIWEDRAAALEAYPDRAAAIENTLNSGSMADTYDDRPKYSRWADNRRTRVRIVQMHWRQGGQWMVATFTRGGYLDDPMPSPYVDREGNPTSSLILRSAYVDRENNRYGHVRDLIPLQDEINKRRSKALHLMSVRQTFGNRQAILDVDKAKRELAKPDGHIEVEAGGQLNADFGVLPTDGMAQAQLELLRHATGEMQASGPNAAMAGKDPRIQSGRAIQAQQAGGAIEVEPIVDDLRQWTQQVMEASWLRVRQFWTGPTWVRVTDDERNLKWVGLNQPVTLADELAAMPPEQAQQITQQYQLQPGDPRLDQVVRRDNEISGLDVDIIIEEGPDVANIQAEQFQILAQIAPALAQTGDPIPTEVLIRASSLRNKDALLDQMNKAREQRAAAQQGAAQIGQAQAEATINKTNSDALKARAQAAESMANAQRGPDAPQPQQQPSTLDEMKKAAEIRRINAQTAALQVDSIKTIADAQRPAQVTDFA
ncbi:hypothetical protein [Pandoraea apista]|uniref:portal protein n=1 Tax=Pandoraea apista TaxID=93218 RepID=UPI00065997C5|nr:hypothetical protein [Pandoraea apista]ALS63617.1 hypothetical protein AT395_00155 [Pandoraea apista]CFB63146.1 hypothetical protein LMG16407_03221 [Pandoraea apista]